ncbi:MAG: hypothetical protein AAF567_21110 [Actinomycetota bacterium]
MNLFRSEESARQWVDFDPSMEPMLKPVEEWAAIFANPFFRQRGRADYLSWTRSEEGQAAYAELRASLSP